MDIRMLLGGSSLLHSFSRTLVFAFPLGPWAIWFRVLGYIELCQGWVSSRGVGFKSNQILAGYFHQLCAVIVLAHFGGRLPL